MYNKGERHVTDKIYEDAVRRTREGGGSPFNYYVIVTREALDNLTYSVTEIYGIRSSGKYNMAEPVYHHMYRIYGEDKLNATQVEPESTIVTEDSDSGYAERKMS